MTRSDFRRDWGTDYRKHASKPLFDAIMEVFDDEGPARKLADTSDNDLLHGGPVFAARVSEHARMRRLFFELAEVPEKTFEPEDKFEKAETI